MANEKRLIDANALVTAIQGTVSDVAKNAPYEPEWFTRLAQRQFEIIGIIDEAPTVDAVEVVRCKDCKYGKLDDTIYCKTVDGETNDTTLYCCSYRWDRREWNNAEHFCSYGERKDDV